LDITFLLGTGRAGAPGHETEEEEEPNVERREGERKGHLRSRPMPDDDAIVFAEKLLALLDAGRYTATYKFAVLIALIDECVSSVDDQGRPPDELDAFRIARRVLELYWPQAVPYRSSADAEPVHLRHSTQANDLVQVIAAYRHQHGLVAGTSLAQAERRDPTSLAALERRVATTVIRMPLPKLQRLSTGAGFHEDRFLYDYGWPDEVADSRIRAVDFDPTLRLRPGVGAWLVRLAGVLRPIIQQRWAAFVAERSRDSVEAAWLDEFLFGASRIGLDRVRGPLLEVQGGDCFYCGDRIPPSGSQVDHFLPWVRHPDNGLDNLVVAHARCNNNKRDSFASADHLARWVERTTATASAFDDLRTNLDWPADPTRTLGSARASYLWLPERTPLWRGVGV